MQTIVHQVFNKNRAVSTCKTYQNSMLILEYHVTRSISKQTRSNLIVYGVFVASSSDGEQARRESESQRAFTCYYITHID